MKANLNQSFNCSGVLDIRDDGVRDVYLPDGGIARQQDITAILNLNREQRNADTFKGFRHAPIFRKVASIPVAVVDILAAQGVDILHDADAMRQFLNDRDNLAFRTTTERV